MTDRVTVSGYPQTWRQIASWVRMPGRCCPTCGSDEAREVELQAVDEGCEDMRLTCCECRVSDRAPPRV